VTGDERPLPGTSGVPSGPGSTDAAATSGPDPGPAAEQAGVPDAARAVLSRVRASARASGLAADTQRQGRRTPLRGRARRAVGGYSGPGPDDRDPMAVGGAWTRLVDDQGWQTGLDVASLLGMWPEIVGSANAEHTSPESFEPDAGLLVIRTSSTAWAEQLRLMLPAVRSAIEAKVGTGVVRDIRIAGPAPPRTRGRLRVRGRGPRDTYG